MKKTSITILALILALTMMLPMMTACSSSTESTAEVATTETEAEVVVAEEKIKVALVLPGKKDDVSFNQAMYEGMTEYAEANPDTIELKVVENMYETADIEPTLIEYADIGYDVIIGHGYQFSEPVLTVAAQYPDSTFLLGCGVGYETNSALYDVKLENGGYLMGVVAALTTETGKIGLVGGGEASEIKRGHEAFKYAATQINPDIEIQEVYTGDWTDTAGAYEAAISMYDSGVDVIWHSGDGIGLGVVQAAQEKDQYVLGNVEDQQSLAPENVLSGLQYQWDFVLSAMFDDIASGELFTNVDDAKTYWIDIANGGITLVDFNDTKGYLTDDDYAIIEETVTGLAEGTIDIPDFSFEG